MGVEGALLTKVEVAQLLRVSVRTLDRMLAAGDGPPPILLPSGRRRWRRGDVEQWIETRRRRGEPPAE
jgi:predicted DNA-binding transcriptional regulator AlpA